MCKYLLEYCYLVYSVQVPAEVRCFHNLLLCVVCRYWSEYAVLLLVALCVAKELMCVVCMYCAEYAVFMACCFVYFMCGVQVLA